MSGLVAALKRWLPWWAKIAAKLVLSRLPIPYRFWKRLSLFEHGEMQDPHYALRMFRQRLEAANFEPHITGAVCLELGPGDSLFFALIARAYGAEKTYLVDAGDFCERDMEKYNAMAQLLADQDMEIRPEGGFRDFEHMLEICRAEYLIDGLSSMKAIPTGSVDYNVSQAVLEHIRIDEFAEMMMELGRVTVDGGVGSHEIDLCDHMGGALNNLRFSRKLWEAPIFANSGFYTNRIRYRDMVKMMENAGFDVEVIEAVRWPVLPTPREKMAKPFSDLPVEDLNVKTLSVVMRR